MPADARTVFSNTLYILWWPTSKILGAIRYILSPFWTLIRFIFLPLTHLIQAILSVVLFPFRVDVLERIETVYVWLGIAALVGCITGAMLYLVYRGLTFALNIDASADSKKVPAKGKTIEEFRAARRERRDMDVADDLSSTAAAAARQRAVRRRGLSSYAIMEEESEF